MTERLQPSRPIADEVRRVGRAIVADAQQVLVTAPAAEEPDWHEAVHELRKSMKEFRALTRLVRVAAPEVHDRWNTEARDLARRVSEVRDAQALLETLDLLAEAFPGVADAQLDAVRSEQVDARGRLAEQAPPVDVLVADLHRIADGVDTWEIPADGFDAVAGGLAKTYRRVQDRLAEATADPSTTALHELRKRVKYHRLHADLLQAAYPTVLDAREDAWHELTDALGDDHDLALLRAVLPEDDTGRAVAALVDRRRAELQRTALLGIERASAEDADALVDRIHVAWDVAAERGRRDALEERALTLENG